MVALSSPIVIVLAIIIVSTVVCLSCGLLIHTPSSASQGSLPPDVTGATGLPGLTGVTGATATSPVGPTGNTGPTGRNFTTSSTGDTGTRGPTGPPGIPGTLGPTGPTGAAGGQISVTGYTGDTGATGPPSPFVFNSGFTGMLVVDANNQVLGSGGAQSRCAIGPTGQTGSDIVGIWFNGNCVITPGLVASGIIRVFIPALSSITPSSYSWPVNASIALLSPSIGPRQIMAMRLPSSPPGYIDLFSVDTLSATYSHLFGFDIMNGGGTMANNIYILGFFPRV